MYIDMEVDRFDPLDYDNYADSNWPPPIGMTDRYCSLARDRQKNLHVSSLQDRVIDNWRINISSLQEDRKKIKRKKW